ncbi:hypothetical protein SDC9_70334 [bioreactor metagenome]|uniref:Uncharacterized protein n=1 Tax=bioreactor metagenome TaxID=1076179 RepID=A0A644Y6Q6_9ZZZZ
MSISLFKCFVKTKNNFYKYFFFRNTVITKVFVAKKIKGCAKVLNFLNISKLVVFLMSFMLK